MNTTINFQISKLLKEKGFEQKTKSYTKNGKLVTVSLTIRRFNPEKIYYPAPTISEVVMWLYEKYGIWIQVNHWKSQPVDDKIWDNAFQWYVNGETDGKPFNSPTQAYEAAIEYTLKELI